MRSVRCDECGTKALTAASQCPKCSHLFALRDGFGELLPLAYCSNCDSYYPESVGTCKWCGTKPEPAPNYAYVWKRVAAAAVVILAGLGFLMRDSRPKSAAVARIAATPKADSSYTALDTLVSAPAPIDAAASAIASVSRVTTASTGNVVPQAAPSAAAAPIAIPVVAPTAIPAATPTATRVAAAGPTPVDSPRPRPPAAAPKARTNGRWVNSVARSWVIVRNDARRDARIIASIGPDSRVQLGESRGSWRRIKARGIAGWVDASASFAAARVTKGGGLAAR